MAKLTALPELHIISGFRGVIDFYVNHQTCDPEAGDPGIPCARRWPRSPGHHRAPAVEKGWTAFSYIAGKWNYLSEDARQSYVSMASGTGFTGRDLFTRSFISGIYAYSTGG